MKIQIYQIGSSSQCNQNSSHLSLCGVQLQVLPAADLQRPLHSAHLQSSGSLHGQSPSGRLQSDGEITFIGKTYLFLQGFICEDLKIDVFLHISHKNIINAFICLMFAALNKVRFLSFLTTMNHPEADEISIFLEECKR